MSSFHTYVYFLSFLSLRFLITADYGEILVTLTEGLRQRSGRVGVDRLG